MSESMRLDAALVARGLAGGRDKAKRLIADGHVTVGGVVVTKPSATVTDDDDVQCAVKERFVGRGGEKLAKVLEDMPLSVESLVCVDIGASTGGFTDCLLQHGAARVFAVDVGHDQLAASLRADARVCSMEGVDIRRRDLVAPLIADGSIDLCAIDVSFISLTQIWDSMSVLLKPEGTVMCLVKPQFEAGRAALSKRGVVRREQDHVRVLKTLSCFWQERGFSLSYLSWSPVCGGDGNIEYVAVLRRSTAGMSVDFSNLVHRAFETLRSS